MKGVKEFKLLLADYLARSKSLYSNGMWQQFSVQYMNYKPEEINAGHIKLQNKINLPNKDLIFRGTIGSMELHNAIETDHLGHDIYRSGKSASFELVPYIRDNSSAYFLSASECPYTAKPYASCIAIMPCRGFMIVMGQPKVFTIPRTLLKLNRKLFTQYDDFMLKNEFSLQNNDGAKYNNITTMAENNNETTLVLTDALAKKNWKPTLANDIFKVVEVCGPGKLVGSMMTFTKPIYLGEVINPQFQKRQWSIEVVLNSDHEMDTVIETAQKAELIAPGHRFLTLEDANALDNSGILDTYIEDDDNASQSTLRVQQVPINIPVGSQSMLVDHLEKHLHESKKSPTIGPKNN